MASENIISFFVCLLLYILYYSNYYITVKYSGHFCNQSLRFTMALVFEKFAPQWIDAASQEAN